MADILQFQPRKVATKAPDAPAPGSSMVIRIDESTAAARRLQADILDADYQSLLDWCGADRERLELAARVRDYHPGWIKHRLREAQEPSPKAKAKKPRATKAKKPKKSNPKVRK